MSYLPAGTKNFHSVPRSEADGALCPQEVAPSGPVRVMTLTWTLLALSLLLTQVSTRTIELSGKRNMEPVMIGQNYYLNLQFVNNLFSKELPKK